MKKISIKREQSQAGLSFAERKKFRPQVKNKLLLLLALLLTAATGAWAQTEELLTTINPMGTIAYSVSGRATLSTSGLVETGMVCPDPVVYGWKNSSPSDIGSVTITAAEGYEITKVVFWDYDMMEGYINALTDNASPFTCYLKSSQRSLNENMSSASTGNIAKIEVYGYATPAPSTYTVSMKSGVKDADKWTVKVGEGEAQALPIGGLKGDGSETVTLQYTGRLKVKGVKATSDAAPAVKPAATVTTAPTAKTGVKAGEDVAIVNAGTADGGTLMYAVTTANTKPTSTEGFSATVPTAKTLAAGTFYVWYYVKGDDSHTDSEISATAIAVTIAEAAPATITVTWNNNDITYSGSHNSFTKDGVTITAGDIDFMDKNFMMGGTFTTTLGNFTKIEVTTGDWYASGTGWSGSGQSGTWTGTPASSVSFSGDIMGMGGNTKFVFTIQPTN